MIQIIPSILTNNPVELKEMLARGEEASDRVSIDIIDGKFADNKTIDPRALSNLEFNTNLDFQLMVVEPINWVERCARVGVDRIIGHIEKMKDQVEFVGRVQEVGASVGLAIDLDTPISKLDDTILTNLDVVLVMGVSAGFGGQKFDSSTLSKVRKLDEIRSRDQTPYKIHIDGGVRLDNIYKIRQAGADEVSVGRLLFKGDIKENIENFTKKAYEKS
jgi:ribulose-phosphate 3-epimerase